MKKYHNQQLWPPERTVEVSVKHPDDASKIEEIFAHHNLSPIKSMPSTMSGEKTKKYLFATEPAASLAHMVLTYALTPTSSNKPVMPMGSAMSKNLL